MRKLHTIALTLGLMAIYPFFLNGQITKIQPAVLQANDHFGASVALNADATYMVVGAPDSLATAESGTGYVFFKSGGTWGLQGPLTDPALDGNAKLGAAVAINGAGTRVALGAPFQENNNDGTVVLFERSGTSWAKAAAQLTQLSGFTNPSDYAGSAVALDGSGNYLAIGIPGFDQGKGEIAVCHYDETVVPAAWSCVEIVNPGGAGGDKNDLFGVSVSLNASGDVLIVGATGEDNANPVSNVNYYGASYIFRRTGTNDWTTIAPVKLPEPAGLNATTRLGKSVDINAVGDVALVGAPGYMDKGAAFVYKYELGAWQTPVTIQPTMCISTGDLFGWSVSIDGSGQHAFFGAPGNDPILSGQPLVNSGALFTFKTVAGVWTMDQKMCLLPGNTGAGDLLGASVSLAQDVLYGAAGAPKLDDTGEQDAGAVYVFEEVALPVTWLSFHAAVVDDGVLLTWSTASESNSEGFGIQRSYNGWDWDSIGFVASKGATSEVQNYAFTDPSPFTLHSSLTYYRLQQRDFNGAIDYSPIRVVQLDAQSYIRVYPNPTDDFVTISFAQPTERRGSAQLLTASGRLLVEQVIPLNTVDFELRVAPYPAGVYWLKVVVGGEEWMRRVIVE
ncbi:MAG: T9SS type A sorting domain-containing protein [Lewinellaceae bacterium]|nr:T9SS type A sorting domain-containing protein [Lewinellaceae bacterium]